jgi:two-component system chemotaxis response regulator CheY
MSDSVKIKTILVVDDSAVMRQMISTVLEEAGYRVLLADDGGTALEQVRKTAVDLVLTDWIMMPMDGGELTRQLRLLTDYSEVPILVLSTVSSDESRAEAQTAGANGWIAKPIKPATLLGVVGSLINRV